MHGFAHPGRRRHGAGRVDQCRQTVGRFQRQHMIQPRRVIGIGQEPVARIIGQLGRFGLKMCAGCTVRVHRRNVEL